jgi:hypothetical protein
MQNFALAKVPVPGASWVSCGKARSWVPLVGCVLSDQTGELTTEDTGDAEETSKTLRTPLPLPCRQTQSTNRDALTPNLCVLRVLRGYTCCRFQSTCEM